MRFDTLPEWLGWQQQLHSASIDMGLERCGQVADHMGLRPCPFKIITVAGTNGKGSCIAFMESMLLSAGYRVGSYCSPHLLRYNERIRVDGEDATDAQLVGAFAGVDHGRGNTSLTFFEFGTLAAMTLFHGQELDIVLLEVGLGGRLDAVNVFDADVSVISSIDIDHTDWLGVDRETIGFEKAGILRAGRPAVSGDLDLPSSVTEHARKLQAPLHELNRNFNVVQHGPTFDWCSRERDIEDIPLPKLEGQHQLGNAAVAIAALSQAGLLENDGSVRCGVQNAMLAGRFQILQFSPQIIVDVAHNPHAVRTLAQMLRSQRSSGITHAFLGMLMDKDVTNVLETISDVIDQWHLAGMNQDRGADRTYMEGCVASVDLRGTPRVYDDLEQGYAAARGCLGVEDRLVAFGSFYTAAHVLRVETSG